jgi:micrococcal nuclease
VRELAGSRRYVTVRLVGIDTPETRKPGRPIECGGKAATSAALRFSFTDPVDTNGDGLLDREGGTGRRVTLRTDPTQDTYDRYGRLLAYVTSSSGRSLQTALLSAGWAKVYVFERPFARLSSFRDTERRARAAGRGVWAACGGNFHRVA